MLYFFIFCSQKKHFQSISGHTFEPYIYFLFVIELWYQLSFYWYFWNISLTCFLMYRLEILTRNVISDAELNFDISKPTFDIYDIVWLSFSLLAQIWNLDNGCNFWSWIEFLYQLAYFWCFWYHLTYCFYVQTRNVISDAKLNFDISWPFYIIDTISQFYFLVVSFCAFFFDKHILHLDQGRVFFLMPNRILIVADLVLIFLIWLDLSFNVQTSNLDQTCNFWCKIEFWFQLT
jgi:hypothetical protein